jgi:hypothetical protein
MESGKRHLMARSERGFGTRGAMAGLDPQWARVEDDAGRSRSWVRLASEQNGQCDVVRSRRIADEPMHICQDGILDLLSRRRL